MSATSTRQENGSDPAPRSPGWRLTRHRREGVTLVIGEVEHVRLEGPTPPPSWIYHQRRRPPHHQSRPDADPVSPDRRQRQGVEAATLPGLALRLLAGLQPRRRCSREGVGRSQQPLPRQTEFAVGQQPVHAEADPLSRRAARTAPTVDSRRAGPARLPVAVPSRLSHPSDRAGAACAIPSRSRSRGHPSYHYRRTTPSPCSLQQLPPRTSDPMPAVGVSHLRSSPGLDFSTSIRVRYRWMTPCAIPA